jgi:hypothetical protein
MVPTDVMRLRENPAVVPMIAGCVDYLFQFAEGHHQTAFVYELDKAGPNGAMLKLDPNEGEMSPGALLLDQSSACRQCRLTPTLRASI